MKIVILIFPLLLAVVQAANEKAAVATPKPPAAAAAAAVAAAVETKNKNTTEKSSDRGKRNLGDFGNFGQTPIADRRISNNGYSNGHYNHYPTNYIQQQNHNNQRYYGKIPPYAVKMEPLVHYSERDPLYNSIVSTGYDTVDTSSNYINQLHIPQQQQHHHQQQPQYLEAPEPIIEIIIKESNESLPEFPQPEPSSYAPKKKEQVQVFYVKYKKDEHDGLVVDNPVPALSPESHNQENDDYHEIVNDQPIIVTPSPLPIRTTTLRTIIHPDSEKYHSNSGIHVTFGTENKHQTGHLLQEENSESNIQPVLLPRPEALVQQPPHPNNLIHNNQFNQQQQQQQKYEQNQFQQKFDQFSNQQTRIVNNFPSGPAPAPAQQVQHHQQQQQQQQQTHHQQLPQPIQNQNFRPQNNFGQQQQQQQPGSPISHQLQLPYQNTPTRPFHNQGPPPNYFQQQQQQQQPPQNNNNYRPIGPPPPQAPVPQQQPLHRPQFIQGPPQPPAPAQPQQQQQQQIRFSGSQQVHQFQQQRGSFNQQHQQQQQHKPIPIPLHNLNQQAPLNRQVPLPPAPPQPPGPQFNQPFNNFQQNYKQQPPLPKVNQLFRQKPAGPPPPPPPPQSIPQQPINHQRYVANQQYNNHQQNYFSQPAPIIQGGLVQQAAPNLGPTANLAEHEQNLKHVLPVGGELVQSVSKYEQHITETVGGQQSQYHLVPQQAKQQQQYQQQQVSHSTPRPITAAPANIGPLANNIGHLNVPQPQALVQEQPSQQQQQQHHHQQQQQSQQSQQQQAPVNYNQLVSGQLFREQVQQQFNQHQQQQQQQLQVIPNAQPIEHKPRLQQNLQNGQSVSNHYSEVFPSFEQEQKRYNNHNYVNLAGRNTNNLQNNENNTPAVPSSPSTTARPVSAAPTSKPVTPAAGTKKPLNIDLPDEVPDDLRQQLLSSGILDNADISVLDYDKIGETALENLPPEHLANFFNAGGGSQIAGSNNVVSIVKPNGDKITEKDIIDENSKKFYPRTSTLPKKQNVDLKVVRFDSNSQKTISDKYIKEDSTVLSSVDISDQIYNRYLPLRINGAQFPIPDVEELKGKKISSVVVLAPVDNIMSKNDEITETEDEESTTDSSIDEDDAARYERDVLDSKSVKFLAGDALKQLIKKPSAENYKRWLEKEGKSDVDLQSVVLLVTKNNDDEQEIFMYDITTKSVSKLSGDLSKAFVDVAAENAEHNTSQEDTIETASLSDSSIVEQMVNKIREKNANHTKESSVTEETPSDLSTEEEDSEQQPSQQIETVVKYVPNASPTTNAHHQENRVLISSGYSVIKN